MPFNEAPAPMLLVPPLALQVRLSPKAMSIRSSHTWSDADLFQEARSGFRLNRCSAYGPATPCEQRAPCCCDDSPEGCISKWSTARHSPFHDQPAAVRKQHSRTSSQASISGMQRAPRNLPATWLCALARSKLVQHCGCGRRGTLPVGGLP